MFTAIKYFFLVLFMVAMVSCHHDPTPWPPVPPTPPPPPPPPPVTTFQVKGQNITVSGSLKPGTKVTVGEAKAAVGAAVKQLETK